MIGPLGPLLRQLGLQIGLGIAVVVVALLVQYGDLRLLARRAPTRAAHRLPAYQSYRTEAAVVTGLASLAVLVIVLTPLARAFGARGDDPPMGVRIWMAGVALLVPVIVYDYLQSAVLNSLARHLLRGGKRASREQRRHIRRVLVLRYPPIALGFAAVGLLNVTDPGGARWLLPAGAALLVLARGVFANPLNRWLTTLTPIEQTPWSEAGVRAQAWAERAGVRLSAVYVQKVGDAGTAGAGIYGIARHRLYLGGAFLAATDWRQRDAVVAHELRHVLRRDLPVNLLASAVKAALLAAVLACLDVDGVHRLLEADPVAAHTGLVAELGRFELAAVLYVVWAVASSLDRVRRRRAELDCDRFSAELTGDPLAMSVALLTIEALTGARRNQRGATHPSTAQRLRRLDGLLAGGSPRAPWARRKVAGSVQVSSKGPALTVPLDQAPPPAPLPPSSGALAAWPDEWPPAAPVAVPAPGSAPMRDTAAEAAAP